MLLSGHQMLVFSIILVHSLHENLIERNRLRVSINGLKRALVGSYIVQAHLSYANGSGHHIG